MGGGASAAGSPAAGPTPPAPARARLAALVSAWFATSVASLFLAKHALAAHPIGEAALTLTLFACSAAFGAAATKGLRLARLAPLSRRQARAVAPLAAAFLTKELLKYASVARVSVNLINTVRSLGPVFALGLEYALLRHTAPPAVRRAMLPIVAGVALTSADEARAARGAGAAALPVFLVGLAAATASTVINQAQNMYSKVLFGREAIDPVSLQIHLSALSLMFMLPPLTARAIFRVVTAVDAPAAAAAALLLPPATALVLLTTGFVNFLSSQLAFHTLAHISPVSYSVANTTKRVVIAVVAILLFGERVSPINAAGIAISIAGVAFYERAARDYKAAKLYRAPHRPLGPQPLPSPSPSPSPSTDLEIPEVAFENLDAPPPRPSPSPTHPSTGKKYLTHAATVSPIFPARRPDALVAAALASSPLPPLPDTTHHRLPHSARS